MKNIYLLIGLPGAGKSYWLHNVQGAIFDDMSQTDPQMENFKATLQQKEIENIYVADVNLCSLEIFKLALQKITSLSPESINFHFVLFNADRETALNNVQYRNDGRYVIPTIERFYKHTETTFKHIEKHYSTQTTIVNSIKMPLMKSHCYKSSI